MTVSNTHCYVRVAICLVFLRVGCPPPLACTSKIARLYFRHLKRFLSTGYKYHRRCSAEEAVRGNPEFKLETAQRKNIAHFRLWPIADI